MRWFYDNKYKSASGLKWTVRFAKKRLYYNFCGSKLKKRAGRARPGRVRSATAYERLQKNWIERPITQLVEFLSYKQAVIGSSPVGPILNLEKDLLKLSQATPIQILSAAIAWIELKARGKHISWACKICWNQTLSIWWFPEFSAYRWFLMSQLVLSSSLCCEDKGRPPRGQ